MAMFGLGRTRPQAIAAGIAMFDRVLPSPDSVRKLLVFPIGYERGVAAKSSQHWT